MAALALCIDCGGVGLVLVLSSSSDGAAPAAWPPAWEARRERVSRFLGAFAASARERGRLGSGEPAPGAAAATGVADASGIACVCTTGTLRHDGLLQGNRRLHANERRGREQDRGNQHERGPEPAAPARECLAETAFVEQAFNALGDAAGTRHGDAYFGAARHGGEFQQDAGIGSVIGGFLEAGVIADGFAQVGELALEPPSQGAEPEDGGVEAGQGLEVEVALAHVGALMGQHDAQFLDVPLVVVVGQHYRRADGDGRGDFAAGAKVEAVGEMRVELDRFRRLPQADGSAQPVGQAQQERETDRAVDHPDHIGERQVQHSVPGPGRGGSGSGSWRVGDGRSGEGRAVRRGRRGNPLDGRGGNGGAIDRGGGARGGYGAGRFHLALCRQERRNARGDDLGPGVRRHHQGGAGGQPVCVAG